MPKISSVEEMDFCLIHPGRQLLKELDERGLTQKDIADAIDKPTPLINEIINGKRRFSAEMSALLGAALEMEPDYWINLQSQYELALIKEANFYSKKIEYIKSWNRLKDLVNVSSLKRRFNLNDDTAKCVDTIFSYFGVSDIEHFEEKAATVSNAYFRRSSKGSTDPKDLLTWTMIVKRRSEDECLDNKKFDKHNEDLLVSELNKVFLNNNGTIVGTKSILAKYGIKFILEDKLDQMPVDGYSFWIGQNPTVAMTRRFKRIDNFAFTLMHEIGHIMQHLSPEEGKNDSLNFYIQATDEYDRKEREANSYAQCKLIGDAPIDDLYRRCKNIYASEKAIISFADENGISRSIVAGQFRHHFNAYSVFNNLIDNIK